MKPIKILLDPGHGSNTPGKRSPDGSLREYAYTREIANLVYHGLHREGIDAEVIVREELDVPLSERICRVNEACREYGVSNVLLISIHVNAAGDGSEWTKAVGWECYTSPGKTKADKLATCIYEEASLYIPEVSKMRPDLSDGDPDKEARFYMLTHSKCPAVLTENLFMDNKSECKYLLSLKGKAAIANIHIKGIKKYLLGL